MGGTICVALRTSDRKEYVWNRWTNSIGWHFSNPLFRQEDPEAIQQFIESGDTSGYGGRVDVIDSVSYGIVGIDFASKTALSRNGYSRLGRYSSYSNDFTGPDCDRERSLIAADERPKKLSSDFPGVKDLTDEEWDHLKLTLDPGENMLIWQVMDPFTLVGDNNSWDTPCTPEEWEECKLFFKDWTTPVAEEAETVREHKDPYDE